MLAFRRILYLFYIGTYLARMHIVSYIASIINSLLWFLVIFGPTLMFSPDPVRALRTFLPGTLAFTAASVGMWVSTEFLRWYVYHGLTDMFRECGLNVFHYLVLGVHIDVLVHVVLSYFLIAAAASFYVVSDIGLILPSNALLFIIAVILAIATYILCGALLALLYTITPLGGVWTNIIQMAVLVGTIIPPTILPRPELALINPATIVAELVRASYGTNIISVDLLIPLTPILFITYIILGYLISKLCEKHIARYGIRYRM